MKAFAGALDFRQLLRSQAGINRFQNISFIRFTIFNCYTLLLRLLWLLRGKAGPEVPEGLVRLRFNSKGKLPLGACLQPPIGEGK
jgi:hypothetical protein